MTHHFPISLLKFFLISLLINGIAADPPDQMKTVCDLRKKLLGDGDKKYDKLSKPTKDHKTRIELLMMVHLFQIVDLSSTGQLKANLLIMSAWDDEHLVWNASDYNGLDSVRFGHDEIWKPDLVIWNYDKGNPWDSFDNNELLVDSNGTVNWDALTHSITYCSLDLREYPFDKQVCSIKIGPWMYNAKDINLTSSKTFDGPFYMNGEWIVSKKEAIIKNTLFTSVELRLTLERRTTIYTYFIVLPYLLSVLFILAMMTVHLDSHQKYLFAGCSIFIQLLLIMFIVSHLGFLSGGRAPRAIRCMSVNILFTICAVCLSTLLTIRYERMKSSRLPLFVEVLLGNEVVGKIFILDLESNRLDSNLIPFVNEEETERTESSIEIQDHAPAEQAGPTPLPNIMVLEKSLSEGELFNLKRWMLFRTLVDRLVLYAYVVILVTFHI